ncbi:hypothetical protein [Methylobacterium sp. A54F]
MRRLLTGGIKAILAIAALSTAAHWAMRVQREPAPRAVAAIPDPATTGSIEARPAERGALSAVPRPPEVTRPSEVARGYDQDHLAALIARSGAGGEKPRVKAAAKR